MTDTTVTQWGVSWIWATPYPSEAEARRRLDLAQMDVPATLVKRHRIDGAWTPWEVTE